ncbi:MAG: hypothetical protein ACM3NP_03190 [Actinomycetota bacterium]
MKKSVITSVLAVLAALTTTVGAQNYPKEYLGLPGDNLNLYAVLDLFRNSPTLEAFERSLNDRDSRINNLDLNGDWRVDYIAVSDYRDGRVHNIVLRAVLGRNEYQDVAVIIVERLKKRRVVIQVIGDELLYGRNYIIEPAYARNHRVKHEYRPVYYGYGTVINNYYYDIWDWPVVVHIYSPYYTGWSSSWYWGYYPTWYEPWSPWYWDYYYGYHSGWHHHYHNYYHHSDRYRYNRYHDYYYHGVRQESPLVQRRVAESTYRQTYSRPEQRAEGAELARRTREAVSRDTRSQTPVNAGSRDTRSQTPVNADSRDTRSQTPVNADGRRRDITRTVNGTEPAEGRRAATGTAGRRAAETEATRRAATGTVSRSAEQTEAARRGAVSTVSRDAGGTEAARRTPATVKSSENEAAEAREAQAREAQQRSAEARENERRSAEARAEQQRAAEARSAQQRTQESGSERTIRK